MLTARVLGLSQTEFLKTFEIVIQFGAILSVIVLYWKSLLINFEILKRVLVAFF
ncbi:MAG: bacA, partial [Deltaproteobacteria bacterium]|nr:bacA [Deltaproteobacteria bacterium]